MTLTLRFVYVVQRNGALSFRVINEPLLKLFIHVGLTVQENLCFYLIGALLSPVITMLCLP